jgi:uncharacterized protein
MEQRLTEFIAGLRAAGVRVSLAESIDALRALGEIGIGERELVRRALQTTLVKEHADAATFVELFGRYFSSESVPAAGSSPLDGLSDEERAQLEQLLEQLREMLGDAALEELLEMLSGQQPLSREQLRRLMQQMTPPPQSSNLRHLPWMARQAQQQMQLDELAQLLQTLLQQLREQGMAAETVEQLAAGLRERMAQLEQQIAELTAERMGGGGGFGEQPGRPTEEELLDLPLDQIDSETLPQLRAIVQRLAARLRSRLALRRRRVRRGALDVRSTLRANLRHGGVPVTLRYRRPHLTARLVVLCDRSVSTQQVMSFLLLLIYTLHDQIGRVRSFAFIDRLFDISTYFAEARPQTAIERIMQEVRPTRSYSTDLGAALAQLERDYGSTVDSRTTLLVLGDGRNNENDPNFAAFGALARRAHRTIWFATEPRWMWGRYDPGSLSSDLPGYARLSSAVHEVTTLRQLAAAVDRLFS